MPTQISEEKQHRQDTGWGQSPQRREQIWEKTQVISFLKLFTASAYLLPQDSSLTFLILNNLKPRPSAVYSNTFSPGLLFRSPTTHFLLQRGGLRGVRRMIKGSVVSYHHLAPQPGAPGPVSQPCSLNLDRCQLPAAIWVSRVQVDCFQNSTDYGIPKSCLRNWPSHSDWKLLGKKREHIFFMSSARMKNRNFVD